MKKVIIIFATLILLLIIFIKVTPFYWGMQAKPPKTLQPEMTKLEADFIKKLKIECDCEVTRHYYNYKNETGSSLENKKYPKDLFSYNLSLEGKNQKKLDLCNAKVNDIAIFIKDIVLQKNKNLNEIGININYNSSKTNGLESYTTNGYNFEYVQTKDVLIREDLN